MAWDIELGRFQLGAVMISEHCAKLREQKEWRKASQIWKPSLFLNNYPI